MEGKRIILIRLRSLGDTLLMTPALTVASNKGRNRVGVVVEEPFDQVLHGNRDVDDIIVPGRRGELVSRLRCVRSIREFGPDLVFDMHGGTTSSLMAFLSGAEIRAGFASGRNSRAYNLKVPPSREIWKKERIHTVEHQLSPLIHAGFKVSRVPPLFIRVDQEARGIIRSRLRKAGIEEFMLIHPAAAFATKQWDPDGFVRVAKAMAASGLRSVTTAGPGQEGLLDAMRIRQVTGMEVIEPLPLAEFIALASECTLYLGNDTGPTHIAAALGKKIVVVFGSSDDVVWHPWGTEYRLLRSELDCIPCPGYHCLRFPEPECIRSIKAEQVLEAVRGLIGLQSG